MQTEFQMHSLAIATIIALFFMGLIYFIKFEKKAKENIENCKGEIVVATEKLKTIENDFERKRDIVEKQIRETTKKLHAIGKQETIIVAESLIQIYGSAWR